jgi:glycine/D-amino acid oxidase-like deaminating enzyme
VDRFAARAVILAGGAWSHLFCGSLRLSLPQLTVRASVMRTRATRWRTGIAAKGPGFGFRKRLDGGYTVAHPIGNFTLSCRTACGCSLVFLPRYLEERHDIQLGLNRRFLEELFRPRRWRSMRRLPLNAVVCWTPSRR